MKKLAILALPLLALAHPAIAWQDTAAQEAPIALDGGAVDIPSLAETEAILMAHVETLASDEYMGRKPGTEGGRMTVAYQIEKLKEYGYEPGWNGSYEQAVPLVTSQGATVKLMADGQSVVADDLLSLGGAVDFEGVEIAMTDSPDSIEAGVSMVGDVAGKIALIRNSETMRGTIQSALEAGALGVIVFTPKEMIDRFRSGAQRERVQLKSGGRDEDRPVILFAGPDAQQKIEAVLGANFAGTLSGKFEATGRDFTSSNVIAKLPGSRPEAGAIVMMAHWDHNGECGAPDAEDRICNGAVDNASGVAAMLETARRLAEGPQLERDVYIFGTTAEEMGLLGARYFADNPPRPLAEIHAALNVDTVAISPANQPISVVGLNRTPLDASIEGVAASLGRTVDTGEAAVAVSERFIRRQDGWALMNRGVPSVLIGSGVGTSELFDTYMSTRYHRANDEIWEGFELGGVASDVPVYVALMRHWATEALYAKPEGWTFEDGAGD